MVQNNSFRAYELINPEHCSLVSSDAMTKAKNTPILPCLQNKTNKTKTLEIVTKLSCTVTLAEGGGKHCALFLFFTLPVFESQCHYSFAFRHVM